MSWSWFGKVLIVASAFPLGIFLYAFLYMDALGLDPWDLLIAGSLVLALIMIGVGWALARKELSS
ncbi:MAG: hypothetical protein QW520_03490 [Methanomassiliicoccales archaeon]